MITILHDTDGTEWQVLGRYRAVSRAAVMVFTIQHLLLHLQVVLVTARRPFEELVLWRQGGI